MAVKKLLVADDSLTIQKVIRLALSGAAATGNGQDGYNIQAVSDGNDAIQQISLFRPDVVLIDVSLPGKSAFEVKRAINEHRDLAAIRFILMSSAFEKVDEEQAQEVVFHGRLTKPFDPAHLREVLSQVLAQVSEARDNGRNVQNEPTLFLNTSEVFERPPAPPPFPAPTAHELPEEKLPYGYAYRQGGSPPPDPPLPAPPELDNAPPDFGEQSGFSPAVDIPMPPDLPAPRFHREQPIAPPPPSTHALESLPPLAAGNDPGPLLSNGYDSDIRALTETTMKMGSGDELGWSVQEHLLKPPPQLSDLGDSTFPISPPPQPPQRFDSLASSQPPPRQNPVSPAHQPGPPPAAVAPEPDPAPPRLPTEDQSPALFTEQMQDTIRQEVAETLQKMVQDVLPEIAERIIKQEIRRMLSDQP